MVKVVVSGVLIGTFLIKPREVDAAVSVSPARIELGKLSAGGCRDREVVVENRSDQVKNVSVRAVSVDLEEKTGRLLLDPDQTTTRSLYDWIEFDVREFSLDGGDARELEITVCVPEQAPSGGYYGAVIVEMLPGTGQIPVGVRLGVPVSLIVPGGAGPVLEFVSGDYPKIVETREVFEYRVDVKNTGSEHAALEGEIELFSLLGEPVAFHNFSQVQVLPGKVRRFSWRTRLDQPGIYRYAAGFRSYHRLSTSGWVVVLPGSTASLLAVGSVILLLLHRRFSWIVLLAVFMGSCVQPAAGGEGSDVPVRVEIRKSDTGSVDTGLNVREIKPIEPGDQTRSRWYTPVSVGDIRSSPEASPQEAEEPSESSPSALSMTPEGSVLGSQATTQESIDWDRLLIIIGAGGVVISVTMAGREYVRNRKVH